MMAKKRTDAERRIRQTDRLARVLRVLQLIQGPGNWNAQTLAKELHCSERTVYRDLQTLSAAGVPWYFDDYAQAYKVREGYRGHRLTLPTSPGTDTEEDPRSIVTLAKEAAERLLVEAEGVIQALNRLSQAIDHISRPRPK
jgi:hypothetical protein